MRTSAAIQSLVFTVLTLGLASGCGSDKPTTPAPDAGPNPSGLVLTVGAVSLGPVNRRLLGNNLQWVDRTDGLVDAQGNAVPQKLELLRRTGPTLLRYPGGTLADGFHFKDSITPLGSRPAGVDLAGQSKPLIFGAGEFLAYCAGAGAEPLVTLNLYSAGVDDALAWLKYANVEGPKQGWPTATIWEVGNEPYLQTNVPAYGPDELTPSEFAKRASLVIEAMRAADASLRFAVPFRVDTLNGVPVTAKPKYLDVVLKEMTQPFELASIHDGYMPLDFGAAASDEDLYLATMAGPEALAEVLDGYRERFDAAARPDVRFALTEYHPWLTGKVLAALQKPTTTPEEFQVALDADHRANSVAGAMYVADLVRMLAYRKDVELASFWSASGNYIFGALADGGILRAPGLALEALEATLRGELLPVSGDVPTLATPSIGVVHAFAAVPALTTLATREGKTVRLLLVNKHPTDPIRVRFSGVTVKGEARVLTTAAALSHDETKELAWATLMMDEGAWNLPPHALVRIDGEQL